MPYLKHIIIFSEGEEFNDDLKQIALVGVEFGTDATPTDELQMQVDQDGDNVAIDLSLDQVKILYDNLGRWIKMSEE